MSQFGEFNAENKLRIPLSAYTAHIIEDDCFSFSKKKTTLINAVIRNYYQDAACSISLRLREYREELEKCLKNTNSRGQTDLSNHFNKGKAQSKGQADLINQLIEDIIKGKAQNLKEKYAGRKQSDENWQITLSKRVKELLTEDPTSEEEKYYGSKPGHYVRALLEEYARLPYYRREEIAFREILNSIEIAKNGPYILRVTNTAGLRFTLKPYDTKTDPLSMFHYLVGYNMDYEKAQPGAAASPSSPVLGLRISRLSDVEPQYLRSGELSEDELKKITEALKTSGIQFLKDQATEVIVRLTDEGKKMYEAQAHLRPPIFRKEDDHTYRFKCTEKQILFYFFKFGKEARILEPAGLADTFKESYKEAFDSYE